MKSRSWARFLTHPLLRRAFWALLLAGHAPAWLAAWGRGSGSPGEPQVLSALIMTLTQVFFALKVVDVRWLRLPADRRVWAVVTVAFALLHAGVVYRAAAGEGIPDPDIYQAVLVGSALLAVTPSVAWRVFAIGVIGVRRLRLRTRRLIGMIIDATAYAWLPPRFLLLAHAPSPYRAPPR